MKVDTSKFIKPHLRVWSCRLIWYTSDLISLYSKSTAQLQAPQHSAVIGGEVYAPTAIELIVNTDSLRLLQHKIKSDNSELMAFFFFLKKNQLIPCSSQSVVRMCCISVFVVN